MKGSEPPATLHIRRRLWRELLRELETRGEGRRESGAFLLGRSEDKRPLVRSAIYFDDLEPGSLNGAVHLTHVAYSRLSTLCRASGLHVLGDVHTHPSSFIAQSRVDQDNPLVARAGHIALIVPNFAVGKVASTDVGVYEYRGDSGWVTRPTALVQRGWFW